MLLKGSGVLALVLDPPTLACACGMHSGQVCIGVLKYLHRKPTAFQVATVCPDADLTTSR